MGRPSANQSFSKKHRRTSNNNVIKKFEEKAKEMLGQSNLDRGTTRISGRMKITLISALVAKK